MWKFEKLRPLRPRSLPSLLDSELWSLGAESGDTGRRVRRANTPTAMSGQTSADGVGAGMGRPVHLLFPLEAEGTETMEEKAA